MTQTWIKDVRRLEENLLKVWSRSGFGSIVIVWSRVRRFHSRRFGINNWFHSREDGGCSEHTNTHIHTHTLLPSLKLSHKHPGTWVEGYRRFQPWNIRLGYLGMVAPFTNIRNIHFVLYFTLLFMPKDKTETTF